MFAHGGQVKENDDDGHHHHQPSQEKEEMAAEDDSSGADNSNLDIVGFKDEIVRIRQEAIELTRRLDDLSGKAEQTVRKHVLLKSYDGNDSATKLRRRRRLPGGELPEREFVHQNSVLTDLFQSKHMQTVQNLAVAIALLWIFTAGVHDFYVHEDLRDVFPGLDLFRRSFTNFHIGILTWLKLMAATFTVFPLARYWACHRPNDDSSKTAILFDLAFLLGYFLYQLAFLFVPYRVVFGEPHILGAAAATAVTMEQVRLMMKMHSFVREVIRKHFRQKAADLKKTDDIDTTTAKSTWTFPRFKQYLYFLFAPTLIYRDEYPRTPSTNWGFVFTNFAQFIACIVYMYYIIERYLLPELKVYDPRTVTFEIWFKCMLRCAIPGMGAQLMSFFGFFHSWLNMWAEMLRFGDRVFYKDWWTCTDYSSYWRQWNCVVHDWLHTYVYKECHDKIGRIKALSAFLVFFVSSVFHEYIISAMMQFFYPLMTVYLSGIGFIMTRVDMRHAGRFSNVFMWWGSCIFMGLMFSLYAFEATARSMCPPIYDGNFLLGGFAVHFYHYWGTSNC